MNSKVDPKIVGKRLSDARKARGITQDEAAKHLGCSRPTLIAIEQGKREAKATEIQSLAKFYGRKVSDFVRQAEPLVDLQPHLRAVAQGMQEENADVFIAIEALQKYAENYHRIESILKCRLSLNYPREVKLGFGKVNAIAEDIAVQERNRLGLGDQPIIHLRSLLEVEVGVRIVYADLPSPIAGMFAYAGDFGGVVAVNRKHPPQRRRATMLHEYGHLITERYKPGIDYVNFPGKGKPVGEKFAEAFSMAFLMPSTSVRRRFGQIVSERGDFQIADLCRLSHFYFVSVEAMTIRLEALALIPKGVREHLKESKFAVRRAEEILKLQGHPIASHRFSDRYVSLAVQAFEAGGLSEGELSSILDCDRVTAREIVDETSMAFETYEDGAIRQYQIDSDRSLLQQ
jgi:Zn-dependent peptidase ImmA (M78 family)/DNA-binding XRE family transcriptional regulator